MLKRSEQHFYQLALIDFIKQKKKAGLFIDMGLGKTSISLTAVKDILEDFAALNVLVIAPLRVANTVWKQEAQKWEHLKDLNIEICTGSLQERKSQLKKKADIHIINKENVQWLVEHFEKQWKWDLIIIDESSTFKSHKAKRFKYLRKILKNVSHLILLTGTPSPQSLLDLWAQVYLLDNGERLGKNISSYRQRFFKQSGYMGFQYKPIEGAEDQIKSLIKDICVTMKAEDYLTMPKRIIKNEYVEMIPSLKNQYDNLQKNFIIELKKGVNIVAPSASTVANKLLQMCNGCVYDEERNIHQIHTLKIEALKEIIEDNPNENLLVAYNYNHDLEALQKAFPRAVVLGKSGKEVEEWNKGKIKLLLAHPASAGYGLNMQYGGSTIIWYGLTWSLENYQQFNKRIDRQGQTKPVKIIHLIMKSGYDELVMKALTSKAKTQDEIMEYLKYQMCNNYITK